MQSEKERGKHRVLFVVNNRKDRSPGQRFRFEQYLGFLGENGYSCDFDPLLDEKRDKIFYGPGNYLRKMGILLHSYVQRFGNLRRAKEYDIIFIFREAVYTRSTFFEKRFAKKAKVIFDFDDSIWLPNVSEANRKFAFLKNPDKTKTLIALADLVFAGNDYLAGYSRKFNSNVAIVPTTIDTDEYRRIPREKNSKICIGWSGSKTTIQHFSHAIPALRQLKEKYGEQIEICVIGDEAYRNDELEIIGLPWKKATEIDDLSRIDIGIMPLPDDEWSRGKCGLKGLQYMALEIPAIMSPVGVNSDIITDGENGMLADTTDEWVEKLSLLVDDADLRKKLGKAGRQTVEEYYSVNAWKEKYLEHFNSLL